MRIWAAGLASLALAGCAAGLPKRATWDEVEALGRPAEREQAARRLRARGPEGLDALVMAAQGLGETRALKMLNEVELGVFGLPLHEVFEREQEDWPAGQAALVACRWLAAQPELALRLARSEDWFHRALAVMSQLKNPAALCEVLDRMGPQRDGRVTTVALAVLQAASQHTDGEWFDRLAERAAALKTAETWSDERCRGEPSGFAALVQRVRSGEYTKGSHSSQNNALSVLLDRPDGREVALGPGCALALYETLAAEGSRRPELIMPLLYWGVVDPELERRAAELVLADLDRVPEKDRNLALARVVNAGIETDRRVQPVAEVLGFDVAEILEAMARQDPEAARSHLEHFYLCSEVFGKAELIALSGLVPGPQAAEQAHDIGLQCEHGLEPALIALLRHGDARAQELLDIRLNKDFPPVPTELIYAIREHRTAALVEHLKSWAASGNEQAKRILDQL